MGRELRSPQPRNLLAPSCLWKCVAGHERFKSSRHLSLTVKGTLCIWMRHKGPWQNGGFGQPGNENGLLKETSTENNTRHSAPWLFSGLKNVDIRRILLPAKLCFWPLWFLSRNILCHNQRVKTVCLFPRAIWCVSLCLLWQVRTV